MEDKTFEKILSAYIEKNLIQKTDAHRQHETQRVTMPGAFGARSKS